MPRISSASQFFHGVHGDNCAQSVARAFGDVFELEENDIKSFAANGGGRAPGGICGAISAACDLLPAGEKELLDLFSRRTGSSLCREIRKEGKVTCRQCVEIAAELLDRAVENV